MIKLQRFSLALVLSVSSVSTLWGQFKAVKVSDSGSGVGIAINPRNLSNLVVSSAPDRIYYTVDKGTTWTETRITSAGGFNGA